MFSDFISEAEGELNKFDIPSIYTTKFNQLYYNGSYKILMETVAEIIQNNKIYKTQEIKWIYIFNVLEEHFSYDLVDMVFKTGEEINGELEALL